MLPAGKPLGWAIVGCGRVADRRIAPALRKTPGAALIGFCSREAGRAAEFASRHGAARSYSSLEAMLSDREVDAVYLATPNHLHAPQAIACLQAGRHVLCDKPLARCASEGQQMCDAARRSGGALGLMHQGRFHPAHAEAIRAVRTGELGELTSIRAQIGIWYPPCENWRLDPGRSGGGAAMDLAPHALDLMLQIADPAVRISGWTGNLRFQYPVEDVCHARIEFAQGGIGLLEASYAVHAYGGRLEIYGSRGTWRIDGGFQAAPTCVVSRRTADANDWTEERFALSVDPFVLALDDFVSAMRAGRPPSVTAEDGVAELRLIEAIYRSAAAGGAVVNL